MTEAEKAALLVESMQRVLSVDGDNAVRRLQAVAAGGVVMFPHGITRIKFELSVDGLGRAGLEIEGPNAGRTSSSDGLIGDATNIDPIGPNQMAAPQPSIVSISPPYLKEGQGATLQIAGLDFTKGVDVYFTPPVVVGAKPVVNSATSISVPVVVDDPVRKDLPLAVELELSFHNGASAKGTFEVRHK